jgi:prevent-host-death family protein
MAQVYSTYEAKAKFSEIIRKVRAGRRVVITFRGEPVAEVRPIAPAEETVAARLRWLEEEGVLHRPAGDGRALRAVVRKRGALSRFLESRE